MSNRCVVGVGVRGGKRPSVRGCVCRRRSRSALGGEVVGVLEGG